MEMQLIQLAAATLPDKQPVTNTHDEWVPYGDDNLYPQFLLELKNSSPTHQSIIKLKTDLMEGTGFYTESGSLPHFLTGDMLQGLATDYAIFNAFALQVIWAKDGRHIAAVQHINISGLRAAKPGSNNKVSAWYYSNNWQQWQESRSPAAKPVRMEVFNPELAATAPRQIVYVRNYSPENVCYPVPAYSGAIADMLFEKQYADYKLNSMRNGMFAMLHVEVEALPDEKDRQAFYNEIKQKLSGAGNAGQVLLTYGIAGGGKTKVTPVNTPTGGDTFKNWAENSAQRIISAHRLCSPILAGLPGSGSLGGNGNEIAVAYEHFFNTVVLPMQTAICNTLNRLLPFTPQAGMAKVLIGNSKPVRFIFSEAVLTQILTPNELREEIGYGPVESTLGK